MIYYALPVLVWFGFALWKLLCTTTPMRGIHYIFALPLILLALLRGEVGPDTVTYLQNARDLQWWGSRASSNEIGYEALVRALAFLTGDPRVVVACISLAATCLFFVMLQRWEAGQGATSLLMIPFCYFDFTMNGLRMGIAFPLAVLAVLQLERKRTLLFYVLSLAAVSVQMTTAFLLVLLLIARWGVRLSLRQAGFGLLLGASLLYPAYYVFDERIALKLLAYSVMSAPASLSGTGPLLMSLLAALLGRWISDPRHRYLGFAFFLVQLVFFAVSSLSYAGLRFQDMALFAQLLSLTYWMIYPLRKPQLAAILLLCVVTCSWTARNFLVTSGERSAFIPYRFFWEKP